MNKFIKVSVIIGIFLIFTAIQITIIHEQQSEILVAKNDLRSKNQEYDYYDKLEINENSIDQQEQDWSAMENLTKLDFTKVVENIQRNFKNHGWMITGFQRLEEDMAIEGISGDVVETDLNNPIESTTITYEIQFVITNGNLMLPQELLGDDANNMEINSLNIISREEETFGVLNISYRQQVIHSDVLLEL